MNYTQKALAILAGIILLLLAFWLVFYHPVAARYGELQEKSAELERRIEKQKARIKKLPRINKEIVSIRNKLARLEVQYPRTIETVYQAITQAADRVGFKILKKETRERLVNDPSLALKEHNVEITARSSFRELGEFLHEIKNSAVIVTVEGLTIISYSDDQFRENGRDLDVNLALTTYLSKNKKLE